MLVRERTFLALSFFRLWAYLHEHITLELKENSTLVQSNVSVPGHPPKIVSVVLMPWALDLD